MLKLILTSNLLPSLLLIFLSLKARQTLGDYQRCISEGDYNTLQALYLSTVGNGWIWKSGNVSRHWRFGPSFQSSYSDTENNPDPCIYEWEGITCNSQCILTEISLANYSLNGKLEDDTFLYLASTGTDMQLSKIDLSNNAISGRIPGSLYDITSLVLIDMSRNIMNGSIPEFIGSVLTNLNSLSLQHNRFEGSLPSSLGFLGNLTQLNLKYNSFASTIPSNYGSLTALKIFEVAKNDLVGSLSNSLSKLSALEHFSVYGNRLTGTVPISFGTQWRSLQFLWLDQNLFEGSIPEEMMNMPGLIDFWINNNKFTGTLSPSLSYLSSLNKIIVQNNKFHGDVTGIFSKAQRKLQNIDLSNNFFTGSIPSSAFNLPTLTTFSASKNCFSGSIPSNICNCTTLKTIALNGVSTQDCGGRPIEQIFFPSQLSGR